jgi:hypothetical protein
MKIDWVRNEIARMRGQIGAQEREIRMRAEVDGLCKERADLRRLSKASVVGGNDP